eukprot:TRINITY_DN48220_c0_g1_i1.p1 TRINITY_DN48220_c0_g1~~TRINITY_DN48220_c0_g1_i1.p1  ORF type:complete len:426 (+),score=64.23 TRINITY_DN48220_c0_g1_i1:186-1280(+)
MPCLPAMSSSGRLAGVVRRSRHWRSLAASTPGCCCRCFTAEAAASGPAAAERPPELPTVAKISNRVCRVLGRNPSPFTLTGTNLYLVGTGEQRILIDAGEGRPGVLADLLTTMKGEGCTGLSQIILTHWHHDHVMGVPELLRHFGSVPVRKHLPPEGTAGNEERKVKLDTGFDPNVFLQDVEIHDLTDGEVLHCEGASLRVLVTPGHANDHVCLMLEEERALFTGDNILGWGTGTFEDLQLYMDSLRRIRENQPTLLYPAHGPVIGVEKAQAWIQMYISHREERIEQVIEALRQPPAIHKSECRGMDLDSVTRQVYKAQPHVFATPPLLVGALNNTGLVIAYLLQIGKCIEVRPGHYTLVAARL